MRGDAVRYRVVYAIDVHAESSLEAVLQAYAGMMTPEMQPVFDVYIDDCHIAQIDIGRLNDPIGELSSDPVGDRS
jgi:hypothetical protein